MEDEVGKYKKKKKSNTSSSKKKAKHKHQYAPCLFTYERKQNDWWSPPLSGGTYCTVCGKIESSGMDSVKEGVYWRRMTEEELLEKYKGCPTFEMKEWFQEYVSIVDGSE